MSLVSAAILLSLLTLILADKLWQTPFPSMTSPWVSTFPAGFRSLTFDNQTHSTLVHLPSSVVMLGHHFNYLILTPKSTILFGLEETDTLAQQPSDQTIRIHISSQDLQAANAFVQYNDNSTIVHFQASSPPEDGVVAGLIAWEIKFHYTQHTFFDLNIIENTLPMQGSSSVCQGNDYCFLQLPTNSSGIISRYQGCPVKCSQCLDLFTCTSCLDGLAIDFQRGICSIRCLSHCAKCINDSQCTACATSFYLQPATQICLACGKYCRTCDQNRTCINCVSGYKLDDKGICVQCPEGCRICNSQYCLTCEVGYKIQKQGDLVCSRERRVPSPASMIALAVVSVLSISAIILFCLYKWKPTPSPRPLTNPDIFVQKPDLLLSTDCPICTTNNINVQSTCGHFFHSRCIMNWVKAGVICPVCQQTSFALQVKCSICSRFHQVVEFCGTQCKAADHLGCFNAQASKYDICAYCAIQPPVPQQALPTAQRIIQKFN